MPPFASILLALAVLTTTCARAQSPITRLYVFGDSYSDTGRGFLDSDGPTAVAYLAQRLHLDLVPSNVPHPEDKSLNFAVSGASTGENPGTPIRGGLFNLGMQNQLAEFESLLTQHKTSFDPATTLFFLEGGLNDSKLPTDQVVANLETIIQHLYADGARHFRVTRLPETIPGFGRNSIRLNPALATIPTHLQPTLRFADIRLSDWGLFYDEILRNPSRYGITDIQDPCVTSAGTCPNPQSHFYFYPAHPSTAAHKIVGNNLYTELTATPK